MDPPPGAWNVIGLPASLCDRNKKYPTTRQGRCEKVSWGISRPTGQLEMVYPHEFLNGKYRGLFLSPLPPSP